MICSDRARRPVILLALFATMLLAGAAGLGLEGVQSAGTASQATPPAATPAPATGESGGYSPSFTVGGAVGAPATYALADLQALPAETVTVQYDAGHGQESHTFQGVRLSSLLMAAAPKFDSSNKNNKINWFIHVGAIDGYQAVVAWGEIDPEEEGKDVLIAYSEDGQLLGQGAGMATLVVPGDSTNSRYVNSITDISLAPAGG